MTVLVVLLVVAAVAGAAYALRSSETPRRPRPLRPGEGIERPELPGAADMVRLASMDREEAVVVQGLLETSGIPVTLRPSDPNDPLMQRMRTPPRRLDVYVAADRAEDAAALLDG
jgi:hypothetical protein